MRVVLYKGNGLVSRLIERFTRSEYSHAAILAPDDTVYEAREFKGVRRLGSLPANVAIDIFEVSTTPQQEDDIWCFLERQVGKKYDYWSVLKFVTRHNRESRRSSGKWFCSELVYAAFEKAGIKLLERIEPWEVSPGILAYSPLLHGVS